MPTPRAPDDLARWPLTSLQAGLSFVSRREPAGGDDLEQLTMALHELLDVDRFVAAWPGGSPADRRARDRRARHHRIRPAGARTAAPTSTRCRFAKSNACTGPCLAFIRRRCRSTR